MPRALQTRSRQRQYAKRLLHIGTLFCVIMVHGCAMDYPRPVYLPPPQQPPVGETTTPPAPVTPEPPYTPHTGPAGSLYHKAQAAMKQGDLQRAEMTLERALRIEPNNGHYWYELARVKFAAGAYDQAIQLCRKSQALAGSDGQLRALNTRLIEQARRAQ